MSEQTDSQPGRETSAGARKNCRGRGRRIALLLLVAVIGGLAGAALTRAASHAHGFGHGFGFHRPALSAEEASRRAERMAKHLAVEVDATPEQTAKLSEIAVALATDIFPMREQFLEARKQGIDLVTGTTVDRAAIEAMRKEQLSNIDAVSQRIATALTEAAEVLRPEQRRALGERIEEWRHWRGSHGPRH